MSELDKQRAEETKILHSIQETRALMSVGELAKGVVYTEPLQTGWRAPYYIREASLSRHERIRAKWHILTDGEDIPPPIKTFKVSVCACMCVCVCVCVRVHVRVYVCAGFLLGISVRGGQMQGCTHSGGHGNCGACSLEGGVGVLSQKILDF